MNSLLTALTRSLGKELVHTDELTLMATSADAGCYRKVPKIVLKPQKEKQVVDALKILHKHNTPLTFRAAGTSLSGQAISDSATIRSNALQFKVTYTTTLAGGMALCTALMEENISEVNCLQEVQRNLYQEVSV